LPPAGCRSTTSPEVVRDHLTYRFVITADGAEAARLEVEA
jgi:hypothetical protein